MRHLQDLLFDAADASANAQSAPVPASYLLYASLHIVSTGAPTATVKFQASNDPGAPLNGVVSDANKPTNWVDIPSATVTLAAPGQALIPKFDLSYNWIRVVILLGGTGTITARLKATGA